LCQWLHVGVLLSSCHPSDHPPNTRHEADFPGLPDLVEATYRTLVGGFIAGEGRFFHETELIPSP
jgi:hypothetical protein